MKKITAKTTRGAAQQLYDYLRELAVQLGNNPEYVYFWSISESEERGYGKCYTVCWEEGPFDWAVALSGGTSIYAGELGNYSLPAEIDVNCGEYWFAEPYNGFIMGFYRS